MVVGPGPAQGGRHGGTKGQGGGDTLLLILHLNFLMLTSTSCTSSYTSSCNSSSQMREKQDGYRREEDTLRNRWQHRDKEVRRSHNLLKKILIIYYFLK